MTTIPVNGNPFLLFAALMNPGEGDLRIFECGGGLPYVLVEVNDEIFGFKPGEARAVASMIAMVIERFDKIPQQDIEDYSTLVLALRECARRVDENAERHTNA